MRIGRGAALVAAFLQTGCGEQDEFSAGLAVSYFDEAPEVVVSTESEVIGRINDLIVLEDGHVYLSDGQAHQIHVVDRTGRLLHSLGREGAGPEELLRPTWMRQLADTLAVVDSGNGRLQLLSWAGAALASRPLPPGAPPMITETGGFVQPVFGADSVLALLYSPDLETVAKLGTSIGPPIQVVRIGALKDQIEQGEVPRIFLNTVEATVSIDGTIWLVSPATGAIIQYGATGTEAWSLVLEEPEFPMVKADFVARNAAMARNALWPLRYILDARPVGSDLWVLLGQSLFAPASILVLSGDGDVKARMTFAQVSGVTRFSVDQGGGFVYFVHRDTAELLRMRYAPAT